MPYTRIGKCVYKKKPNGQRGERVGCSDSVAEAKKYLAKLRLVEAEEKSMNDKKDASGDPEIQDMDTKNKPEDAEKMRHWTYAKNFDEYEKEEDARKKAYEVQETVDAIPVFIDNVMRDPEEDKLTGISKIFEQAKMRFNNLLGRKETEDSEDKSTSIPDQSSLLITKNADGRYVWVARYSNNARDIDHPPEIIASKSHDRFVRMVDSGEYPLPELQIWHEDAWKIGQASVVDYDKENGFAVAAGFIDPDKEHIAKSIAALDPNKIRVSHGMPYGSIVRDSNDPTIIIEHQTKEISLLPAWAAANPLTGFIMTAQKENKMLDPTKTQKMNEDLGITPEQLEAVEAANAADKAQVEEAGIETKEKAEEEPTPDVKEPAEEVEEVAAAEPEAETETEPEEDVDTEEKEASQALRVEDVVDAIKAVVVPLVERIDGLETQVKELSADDEEKIAKEVATTPRASLFASLESVVGNPKAQVDGRTKEGKDAPKETPAPKGGNSLGLTFVDAMREGRDWREDFKGIAQ